MQIASIKAYQVLDSRGEPTIRVRMESDTGSHARFDAPSSISVAELEAKERRDGNQPFGGNGVTGNVETILNIIAPKFIGYPLGHQSDFDALITALDGTADRSNLGSNTLTAVSGAYFLLSSYEQKKEIWQTTADILGTTPSMPRLYANLVSGGAHALGLDVQEFMIVPKTTNVTQAIELIYGVHHTARSIFQSLYGPTVRLVADEGSMAPVGSSAEVVLDAFQQLASRYQQGYEIALDMAAYNLFQNGSYLMGGQSYGMEQLGMKYMEWDRKFPIVSIEDPFAAQDLEGLKYLSLQTGRRFMVAGDGVTATEAGRITELARQKLIGAVVIKPSQVGTISETFDAIKAAREAGLKIIIAHRSGETNDTFLADIAYGAAAFGFKPGAPVRGERVAKYNRLIEISSDAGITATSSAAAQLPSLPPLPSHDGPVPLPLPDQPVPLQPIPSPSGAFQPMPSPSSSSSSEPMPIIPPAEPIRPAFSFNALPADDFHSRVSTPPVPAPSPAPERVPPAATPVPLPLPTTPTPLQPIPVPSAPPTPPSAPQSPAASMISPIQMGSTTTTAPTVVPLASQAPLAGSVQTTDVPI